MEYRTLGRTGVRVSAVCMGTMMFGPWGNEDTDECVRMVHRAMDAGVNFIDTADVYSSGVAEEVVGKALTVRRDQVVLATKVHGQMGERPNERGASRLWIMRAVEASLRRLGTDHIDLYQIHRPDPSIDLEETLGALSDLVRQGKVRYAGSSAFPAWHIVEAHWVSERRGLERFSTEQPPFSIFVRGIERDVLPVAQRYRMGVLTYSPLNGGWLTGKYRRGEDPPGGSRGERMKRLGRFSERFDLERDAAQRKLDLVERLDKVADQSHLSLTEMSISFTLSHPAVTSVILGPRTPEQLEDLLVYADTRLDGSTLQAIDEIVPPGTIVDDADRGWEEPWMRPAARRR